jgi:hypothetical protein
MATQNDNVLCTHSGQVLDRINNPFLTMHKGPGYWYFVFDDESRGIYESHSVYVNTLRFMTVTRWEEEARSFLAEIEAKHKR